MKKALIILGTFLFFLVFGLLIAPLFIDFGSLLKPVIAKAIDQNLHTHSEIGNVRLGFMGGFNVNIESLRIVSLPSNNELFEGKAILIAVPYSALFGKKDISIEMDA